MRVQQYSTAVHLVGPPIRNTYCSRIWSERQTLIFWSKARPLSYVRFLIHRRFRIAFFLHVYLYFEREFLYWRRLFWKGAPLLRMRRGVGCWQPKRRLPPAATSNQLRITEVYDSLQSAPASMLQSFKGRIERKSVANPRILCVLHFIHDPIRTWCISCFNSTCMLLFLVLPFLIRVAQTSSFS